MAQRYEYALKVWHCKLDNKPCDYDGGCDMCYWAKTQKRWDIETAKYPDGSGTLETKEKGDEK